MHHSLTTPEGMAVTIEDIEANASLDVYVYSSCLGLKLRWHVNWSTCEEVNEEMILPGLNDACS